VIAGGVSVAGTAGTVSLEEDDAGVSPSPQAVIISAETVMNITYFRLFNIGTLHQ
jgi:hypothetical protein